MLLSFVVVVTILKGEESAMVSPGYGLQELVVGILEGATWQKLWFWRVRYLQIRQGPSKKEQEAPKNFLPTGLQQNSVADY